MEVFTDQQCLSSVSDKGPTKEGAKDWIQDLLNAKVRDTQSQSDSLSWETLLVRAEDSC